MINWANEHPFFGRRLALAATFCLFLIGLLILRLWFLQGVYGHYYRDQSENNRIRTVRTAGARGSMFDREGRILVRNRPAFDVAIVLEDSPDVDQTIKELSLITNRDPQELKTRLQLSKSRRPFEPTVVMADVSRSELARIKANSYRLPGVIISISPTREYPYHDLAAQMFGYSREITKEQLSEFKEKGYRLGSMMGQAGLEKEWESDLRGHDGQVFVEVDARGNRRGELDRIDDVAGDDLYLTLDVDLQRVATEALRGQRGAVIALDPNNGDILAMVSSPSFDANIFSGSMNAKDWQAVSTDKELPLNNRVIGNAYPPGSTFKLVMSLAGLSEGIITPEKKLNCPGHYFFGGRPYHCHKREGHGAVDLGQAFELSCNVYYYQLGNSLGVDKIHKYASMLGLGKLEGIKLPGEKSGIIPSSKWKVQNYGERWYPGETLSVSVGQGFVTVTPLQMAVAIATIANGGKRYRPHLVSKIVHREDGHEEVIQPELVQKLPIKPEVFENLKTITSRVVQGERGTGKNARIEGIEIGGKTGTAQVASLHLFNSKEMNDHAWFVSYAPVGNPMIAMAILVENGGHGGTASAPISKLVMEEFFRKKGMLVVKEEELKKPADKKS